MKKIAILATLAAILTTGLMADKCTYAPAGSKPDAPATTEPAPDKAAPETPAPAQPAQ